MDPVAGVVAEAGLEESQLPPEVVAAAAVKTSGVASLLVTCTFCGEAEPPDGALKLSADELRLSIGRDGGTGVTTSTVTPTVCGLLDAPVEAIETWPW